MLDIRDLSYRYPGATQAALDGATCSVQRGQVLGLLGPNGAGKSTLVAHLAGLLPVQQGEILVDREPLADCRRRDPTRIAIAPQEYAFYPMLSVRENLACFAAVNRLTGASRASAILRALDMTGLGEYADTRGEKLSGGLRRRLNLAIALLARPALIVLDEPTVGVDAQSRRFLLDSVRQLANAGAAVIYTTHYLEEVEAIADQVAILHRGRMLRLGTLADLLAEGASHLSARFAAPPPDSLLQSLQTTGTVQVDGSRLHLDLAPGVPPLAALPFLERCGVPILELHAGHHSLEQLFVRLTGEHGEHGAHAP
ncbi:MAG: ABC transporter ATP-binding protein [Thiobacillus sp.]|nr:ABC transporter ATP-binding protein [Thiobacillus sp.]